MSTLSSTTSDRGRRTRRPSHPGAVLADILPDLRMSVAAAAREMGVSRQTLHRILSEKAPVTPEMALRIGKFCGNGPGIWLRLQQAVDLWDAERKISADIKAIKTQKAA